MHDPVRPSPGKGQNLASPSKLQASHESAVVAASPQLQQRVRGSVEASPSGSGNGGGQQVPSTSGSIPVLLLQTPRMRNKAVALTLGRIHQ